jgi:hypothetical protein
MRERVYERLYFDLGNKVKAEIWHTSPKRPYLCRITFPDGVVVDSIRERLSWLTVDGAKAWARKVVEERAK